VKEGWMMTPHTRLSDLDKTQLRAIDDIKEILDEKTKDPIYITADVPKEEKDKIAELLTEMMLKAYAAGYKAAKEE
jgi:hypothetical protein